MWSFVAHFERGKLAVSQWHKKENNIARNEDFVDGISSEEKQASLPIMLMTFWVI